MNFQSTFPGMSGHASIMRSLIHVRPISVWKIYDPVGVWVGNVDTLLLDPATGSARFAWTSFFEVETGQIALPWRALTFNAARASFVTLITKRQMLAAPQFKGDEPIEDVEHQLAAHYRTSLRAV